MSRSTYGGRNRDVDFSDLRAETTRLDPPDGVFAPPDGVFAPPDGVFAKTAEPIAGFLLPGDPASRRDPQSVPFPL